MILGDLVSEQNWGPLSIHSPVLWQTPQVLPLSVTWYHFGRYVASPEAAFLFYFHL